MSAISLATSAFGVKRTRQRTWGMGHVTPREKFDIFLWKWRDLVHDYCTSIFGCF